MKVNNKKTKFFYKNYNEICDCIMCKFYIEKISDIYPQLNEFLDKINVDIKKPLEVGYPYLDPRENLIYPFSQYIVIGQCDDFYLDISDLCIRKADAYPDLKIDDDYFVLDVFDLVIDRKFLTKQILNDF